MPLPSSLEWRNLKPSFFEDDLPTILEMREFAGQFTLTEWLYLCQNPTFIIQVDRNLKSAARIASLLLKKHVVIWMRAKPIHQNLS